MDMPREILVNADGWLDAKSCKPVSGFDTSYTLTSHMEAELKRHKEAIANLQNNLRRLASYSQWQMDEGSDYHPTLPSAVKEARQAITATADLGDE